MLVLDEAHERSLNTDILFGLLKELVQRRWVALQSAPLRDGWYCRCNHRASLAAMGVTLLA